MNLKKKKQDNKKFRESKEKVSGFIGELVRGARDIKMLNSEKSFINELTLKINRLNESRYSMVDIDRNYGLLSGFNRDLSDLLLIVVLVVLVVVLLLIKGLVLDKLEVWKGVKGGIY